MSAGNLPPKSRDQGTKYPTLPRNISERRRFFDNFAKAVGAGQRISDLEMTATARYLGIGVSDSEVTHVAVSALFAVYDSRDNLTGDDIANRVQEETGAGLAIDHVIDGLFEQNYLRASGRPDETAVLGYSGVWLLEMLSMHGQETGDPMALAETSLRETAFFIERVYRPDGPERFSALL